MQTIKKNRRVRTDLLMTAAVATIVSAGYAAAGTTGSATTVSTAGSTALKNWFVAKTTTFTDVTPGTTLSINGTSYPPSVGYWAQNNSSASTLAFQLAPKLYNTGVAIEDPAQIVNQASAVRFEFHESGSVEGILEMANDQIGPVNYVTQNVDRNPSVGLGNAVWVNYSQIGGKGGLAFNASTGGGNTSSTGTDNYNLGNFYTGTSTFTLGGSAQPSFNLAGGNLNGGQNAVQLAVSDAVPVQVFAAPTTGTDSHAATPWLRTPADANYGSGNISLVSGNLGTAAGNQHYQSTAALNMSATAINPRTGTAFGTGTWNSAGLGNLNSQLVAITATQFVANPGTGLTQVDRTDAQWLETTGRLQNGALFNMTTRDVNSGTRNVAALETGIDPTWASGANDNGNGNALNGAGPANSSAPSNSGQISIGPDMRFSNKTAGGNELRPTVQANRMAVGTLSINDTSGVSLATVANPLRALMYSDSTTETNPVLANYYTISGTTDSTNNPTGLQYTIFQNEQFVTLKAPNSSYATTPTIQGDDTTGDVKALINNSLNSVSTFYTSNGSTAATSPAAGLQSQGFILPQLMHVRKDENGIGTIVPNTVDNGATAATALDPTITPAASLINALNQSSPSAITTGSASTVYGGSSAAATAPGAVDQIKITSANYLFGNFNQNGVRDYDAVVVQAQKAQAALAASGAGTSMFSGSSNATTVATLVPALDAITGQTSGTTGATKGDLIVLGDYNGDGKFDGQDLYLLATGASLSSTGSFHPTETTGSNGSSTFTTGTVNASAGTFSDAIAASVLNKNTALDYLKQTATAQQAKDGAAILELPAGIATYPTSLTSVSTFVAAGTDPVSGQLQYTFDSAGTNAFNKTDVNRDGVVDFNDLVLVDNNNGKDYSVLADTLGAYEQAPVTGITVPANLVLVSQTDTSTRIGANDLTVANTALTGTGNTNWYGYALNKTGPGTITFTRTGGTVTVFSGGAGLNLSSGTVQIGSTMDPFTDSTATASKTTTAMSVAIVVNGGTLEYLAGTSTINLQRLSSLNVGNGSVVKLDASAGQAGRTALEVGSLTMSGGQVDLGNGDLIVQNGSLAAITSSISSAYGYNGGNASAGIVSSVVAADSNHLTALGVVQNNQAGSNLFSSANQFDGIVPNAGDVLVKYTYVGDANLDGKIDGSDYSLIDAGYTSGGSKTGWYNGDFNYDGVVDGSDYTLLDNAFNNQGNVLSTPTALTAGVAAEVDPSAVPEPTSLGLIALGTISLVARRNRRQA